MRRGWISSPHEGHPQVKIFIDIKLTSAVQGSLWGHARGMRGLAFYKKYL